jgi:hypothetical protein
MLAEIARVASSRDGHDSRCREAWPSRSEGIDELSDRHTRVRIGRLKRPLFELR